MNNSNNQNTGISVRYAFSSEEGAKSAMKTLQKMGLSYSDDGRGVFIINVFDRSQYEAVTREIGRDMTNSNIDCNFVTNQDGGFNFNSLRDFGPNPTLLNNLDALKYIYQNTSEDVCEVFNKFVDNLPKTESDDLLIAILGINWRYIDGGELKDLYSFLAHPSRGTDVLADAYQTMKKLYAACTVCESIEKTIEEMTATLPIDCGFKISVNIETSEIVKALDVIIQDRLDNE